MVAHITAYRRRRDCRGQVQYNTVVVSMRTDQRHCAGYLDRAVHTWTLTVQTVELLMNSVPNGQFAVVLVWLRCAEHHGGVVGVVGVSS